MSWYAWINVKTCLLGSIVNILWQQKLGRHKKEENEKCSVIWGAIL